jgi:hypothetical protein
MSHARVCTEILAAVLYSCMHIVFLIASRTIPRSGCFTKVFEQDPLMQLQSLVPTRCHTWLAITILDEGADPAR